MPEEGDEEKPDIIIEDFGKLLAKQDNNEEKVLLYSKLGTLNFDGVSNDPSNKQESEESIVEIGENAKSIRISDTQEEVKQEESPF